MKQRRQSTDLSGLLVLLLFTVFAVCVLLVLQTGAGVYRRLTARDEASYSARTAVQYIATRVRQADTAGNVLAGTFDAEPVQPGEEESVACQGDTLFLVEEIGGERYCTRLYCAGGYLRELFGAAGEAFAPEDGEAVLPAQQLQAARSGNRLEISLTQADGTVQRIVFCIRSEEEAPA
jgi:hypothetical protein